MTEPTYTQAELEAELAKLLRVQELRRHSGGVRAESARDGQRINEALARLQKVELDVISLNHYLNGDPGRAGDIGILGRVLLDIAAIPERVTSAIHDARLARDVSIAQSVVNKSAWVLGGIVIGVAVAIISHWWNWPR